MVDEIHYRHMPSAGLERGLGIRLCVELRITRRTATDGIYASLATTLFERRAGRIPVMGHRIA